MIMMEELAKISDTAGSLDFAGSCPNNFGQQPDHSRQTINPSGMNVRLFFNIFLSLTIDVLHAVYLAIKEILAPVDLVPSDVDLIMVYALPPVLIHQIELALP